jgi:ABC-type multidrug transport system fused ATPase/permease subunit
VKRFFLEHRKSFDFIWNKIFSQHIGYFAWTLLSLVVSSAIAIVLPYLAKIELDQLTSASTTIFGLTVTSPIVLLSIILITIFITELTESVVSFLFSLKTRIQKEIIDYGLKKEIYSRIYQVDPGYTMMERFRRMMSSVTGVINNIPDDIERLFRTYIGSFIEIITVWLIASFFDWRIFALIALASLINYGINRFSEYYNRKHELSDMYELSWEMHTIERAISESYHHIASNGAADMLLDRYFALKMQQLDAVKKQEKIGFITRIAEQLSNGGAILWTKIIVGYLIFAGTWSVGLMVMTTMYTSRISRVMDQFFRAFSERYELVENISILQFFLDFIDEKSKHRTEKVSHTPISIDIKKLNFSYPKPAQAEVAFLDIKIATLKRLIKSRTWDSYYLDELHTYEAARKEALLENPQILTQLDISFQKGKIYGIVGKNGAGKTTLTSILLWFFSEYTGSIQIDGKELSQIDRVSLQQLVGYVSQDPYTMHGRFTIRDNLTLWVQRQVDDSELYRYLDMFGIWDRIRKEREWLSTRLQMDMDLSGWQKQILVLIRVMLQDRPILILDEWTNQLDSENEMLVMNNLLKNRKDKIIIFVTHRMNTMKKCDWIYTIEAGNIQDSGTPKELATRENIYRQFLDIWEQDF